MKNTSAQRSNSRPHDRGSVFVEFGMTVPLIIVFLTVLLDMGRTLGQISWMSQVAYQIVMTGSESPVNTREQSMLARSDYLHQLNVTTSHNPGEVLAYDAIPDADNSENLPRTVSVLMKGNVRLLMNTFIDVPINVRITGPVTAVDRLPPGNLENPENPDDLRDCNGGGTGTTSSCLTCVNSGAPWYCNSI